MKQIDMDDADISDIHLQIRRACHDLNAPLRAVHGFADILQQREASNLSERGQLYLQRMVIATGHMEQVVEGLHQYARLATRSLQLEPISIQQLTHKFLTAYYSAPIRAAELDWNVSGDSPSWMGDRELLHTIMRALVDNALRFTDKQHAPQVSLSWKVNTKELRLFVSDHGIGIEEAHQQRIFNLFERLHNREQYPGAGAGLTLALKATQMLQGTISVHSVPGQGTTLCVVLPCLFRVSNSPPS